MRYPVLVLRRRDLVAGRACSAWLWLFDDVCAMRDASSIPLVRRRDGSTYRDRSRLRIELSPLAQMYLSRELYGSPSPSGTAWRWLRERGIVGAQNFRRATLRGADLSNGNFIGADFSYADLSHADLRGALLHEAGLSFAALDGALRLKDDGRIRGYEVRGGMLVRSEVQS